MWSARLGSELEAVEAKTESPNKLRERHEVEILVSEPILDLDASDSEVTRTVINDRIPRQQDCTRRSSSLV